MGDFQRCLPGWRLWRCCLPCIRPLAKHHGISVAKHCDLTNKKCHWTNTDVDWTITKGDLTGRKLWFHGKLINCCDNGVSLFWDKCINCIFNVSQQLLISATHPHHPSGIAWGLITVVPNCAMPLLNPASLPRSVLAMDVPLSALIADVVCVYIYISIHTYVYYIHISIHICTLCNIYI